MEYTMKNITQLKDATTRNYSKLPRIDFFRINIGGVTGTKDNRHVTVYEILVQTHGSGEFRRDTDVAAQYGMKLPHNTYKNKAQAFQMALEYKKKWGFATSKNAQKREAENEKIAMEATRVAIENMVTAMKEAGMSDALISAILKK